MKVIISALFLLASLTAQAAITVGTYNIRNFDYDERYKIRTNKVELSNILKNLNVDVMSISEINNTAEFERFVAAKMPGYDAELTRCGGAHGQRLGFLYNKAKVELLTFNEDLTISNPNGQGTCDSGSRPLAIGLFQIKATKQKFYAMTAHLKSGSAPGSLAKRIKQYEIIKLTIKELSSKTPVKDYFVGGDLNTTEYISRGSDFRELNKVIKELGLVHLTSNVKCSAYWWGGSDDGIETPSLLDHMIVTPGLVKNTPSVQTSGHCQKVSCRQVPVKELGISYESVSDHCPITATIQ